MNTRSSTRNRSASEEEEHVNQQLQKDELSAKKKCLVILQEMEFRAVRAAAMNYLLSSQYETYDFRASMGFGLATGIVAFPISNLLQQLQPVYSPNAVSLLFSTFTGMMAIALVYTKIGDYIIPHFRMKTKEHNKAGASWQQLEFNIRSFTASSTKETSIQDYKTFLDKCAENRKDICNIARPTEKVYEEYEQKTDYLGRRYKKLAQCHKQYRQHQREIEEEVSRL